jgi:tetratricopeptide (TPR) repeat protein
VSAPFSQGSSGGALVNSFGEVIGVTCGGHDHETAARANINFAVWIGELEELPSINKPIVLDTTVYYNSQLSQSFGILLEDFRADNLNIEKILEYYVQCAELRTNMFGEYQSELPFIYEYIGLLYYELANFELAIKWIFKSLDIHQKVSEESLLEVLNSERHCGLAFKLAVCYEQTKDLNNALTYYIESVKINQEHFGRLHHKTKNAVRMARKLAQDLKRESDLPEWMITIREA